MALIETYVKIKNYHDYPIAPYSLEEKEALEVVQALARQVSRKPIIEGIGEKTISGRCPNCDNDVVYSVRHDYNSYKNYCRKCGQKIDWSDWKREED